MLYERAMVSPIARPDPANDLADLSAADLLALYSRRSLSPVDVMRAVIARIEQCEPRLKALYAFDPDGALAAARDSEARWLRQDARALEGVPATLKDNVATRGVPVPLGTAARPLVPEPADAPPAARLREAGAILFAKTTMPDYGMLSSGLSSFHPLTRNPWDLSRNPGGSSAGAGAAAAAGYGPFHVGTDIGGSIRLPAGWCGVFGFKPSLGRVPIEPSYYGRVAGPMTRTVADAALMMGVLSLPDERDTMSLPPATLAWTDLAADVGGLKLGLWLDAGTGMPLDAEMRAVIEAAAETFAAAGARVAPVAPFVTPEMIDGLDRFWRARAWADIGALDGAGQARVLPYIHAWAAPARDFTGADVFHGMSQMMALRNAAVAACRGFDLVLSPVSPVSAFPAELASPLNDPGRPFDHIAFTVPFNMSEQPAASVNAGYTKDGLPVGLQIVGRRFDDLGVLRAARAFERLRPAQRAWPVV
jgi:Asp-tRNA(Asn)/Glu-tRNA(Gln) amidotransferase A subunit family amidase